MKLSDHVDKIRQLIDSAFRNRLGRMGINGKTILPADVVPAEYVADRTRLEDIYNVFIAETGTASAAFEKLVEEFSFTLFNRLAALKVMEAHTLHPEIVTRRSQHGDRSFAHLMWLEQNPGSRNEEMEGLVQFFFDQLESLSGEIPLFSTQYPYHLLPTAIELNNIITAFNQVETDSQVEPDIWQSDDVLGWLYESYNNKKKIELKDSGEKIEYNKVSLQSQVYTPRWVVKFLVDNSLGKLYLEMYPDSDIKSKYKIANAPQKRTREPKSLKEIKLIDPAPGSGNFLLYAFDLFYDLYLDRIENYVANYDKDKYDKDKIAEYIIHYNLHGIDLDDRAVQIAQLGLYIKAKRYNPNVHISRFNVVSSDFFLPEYSQVQPVFENNGNFDKRQKEIIREIWADLQNAYKFGSLIRLEEKLNLKWFGIKKTSNENQLSIEEYDQQNLKDFETFRTSFFTNLQTAVEQNTIKQGITFLNTKTRDAITYLQLLSQKYDVAVANPPYTDSADFGTELKKFVEANYKQPYKFHTNLYATFIKRCYELIDKRGKMALIHPLTFMYIKTFQDVRKFILENTHISIFVDYGLSNLFGAIMVDPAFYVFEKDKSDQESSLFISLDQYTRTPNEKYKKDFCLSALDDYISNRPNKHNYSLPQEKLKIIEGWPFIYWISDGFREKFKGDSVRDVLSNCQGLATTNNNRFVRLWWEVNSENISINYNVDYKKWVRYAKGGTFNKWYGNNWLVVNWEQNGFEIKEFVKEKYRKTSYAKDFSKERWDKLIEVWVVKNNKYYFKEGVTYSASGSKGASFRYHEPNQIFDVGGSTIFPTKEFKEIPYITSFFNSHLCSYIIDCLNPTVNTQAGDIERIPFLIPDEINLKTISNLGKDNIEVKKQLCSYCIIETNFEQSPLTTFKGDALKGRILAYLNFENAQLTCVLLHEAIINELILEVYELSEADREQVEAKMGKSIGALSVLQVAKDAFIAQLQNPLPIVAEHIQNLPVVTFEEQKVREIKEKFASLYQSNNDLEEFCIRNQVNPINVWYWFKEANIMSQTRAAEIALEFLADAIRTLLQQDDDGIIPLIGLPGEDALSQRLEQHCLHNGFTSAQYVQLDSLLGRPLNEYLEHHFFRNLSDHLNLFMYLPKTPFIWHLSSGQHQGFEAFILIYKWNRDSLFKLKSHYLSQRTENLQYRQMQLQGSESAQALNERDLIRNQLDEIKIFTYKIDELIAEGYNPKLDDGVGKNIAPLQKKGLLRAEVLNNKQLQKYLNADW